MRQHNVFAGVLLSALAVPAMGGWQNTEWGMSPTEVKKSLNMPTKPFSSATQRPADPHFQFKAPYIVGQLYFTANFRFTEIEGGGLDDVALQLNDSSRKWLLLDSLIKRYGPPDERHSEMSTRLTWYSGEDRIDYIEDSLDPPNITVIYKPKVPLEVQGL